MANIPKASIKYDGAHLDNIWTLGFTSTNQLLTGSLDSTVKLWSIQNSDNDSDGIKCVATSAKGSGNLGITSVTSTKDGLLAVVCFQDSTIAILSLDNLNEVSKIDAGLMQAYTACLSPSDDVIVAGNHKGSVNIWSMSEGHEKVAVLETNNKFILNSTFNIDGKLATVSIDGFLNVFDVETKQIIHKVEAHSMPCRSVVYSPNGNLIITASDDRHVSVFDTISGTIVNSFSQSGMANCVDISQDHRHFAVACSDNTVSYWDLGMQRCLRSYDAHKDQVWGVQFDKFSENKKKFASVGDDGLIQLFE